jgi:predicted PurR-regulated permease PerM
MVSFDVAIASLAFLVIVHKLEYYVNAKIVGEQIKTSIWEMLIVMLILESAFGVLGAVLGPVLYGYIKEELQKNKLV